MVKCTVKVPATTANLGPGFDSVGCAFALYNTITFTLCGEKTAFKGCDEAYANEDNLTYVAFKAVYTYLNKEVPPCLISFDEVNVPLSRGLGSSAALIVAGAVGANTLLGNVLSKEEILKICNEIEGHPDNLSPAIYGGLTASMVADGTPVSVRYEIHSSLRFVALIPAFELLTKTARSVLPKEIDFRDAVFNASHLAVLLKALENGDKEAIALALDDKLHQPYRKHLIKDYEKAEKIAKELGAISFCISGAGPTCLTITDKEDFAEKLSASLKNVGINWQVLSLEIDRKGAHII